MKLYIAGPMTGVEEENRPEFNRVASTLRQQGHEVVNPAELDSLGDGIPWDECMRRDIPHLLACEAVCVLPGWFQSRGAKLEVFIASMLSMPLYRLHSRRLTKFSLRARWVSGN